jgi:hypothetical protein
MKFMPFLFVILLVQQNIVAQELSLGEIWSKPGLNKTIKAPDDLKEFFSNYMLYSTDTLVMDTMLICSSDTVFFGRFIYSHKHNSDSIGRFIYDYRNKVVHFIGHNLSTGINYPIVKRLSYVSVYDLDGRILLNLINMDYKFQSYNLRIYQYEDGKCIKYLTFFNSDILIFSRDSSLKYVKIEKSIANRTIQEYFEIINKMKEEAFSKPPIAILSPDQYPEKLRKRFGEKPD